MLLSLQKFNPFKVHGKAKLAIWLIGAPLATALPVAAYVHAADNHKEHNQKSSIFNKPASKSNQETTHVGSHTTQSVTSDSNSANGSSTNQVTVNGQNIPVPQNGSVHKTITSDNGNTQVDIDTQNNHNESGSSQTNSSNIHVYSHSSSSSDTSQ